LLIWHGCPGTISAGSLEEALSSPGATPLVGEDTKGDTDQPGSGIVGGWDVVDASPGDNEDLRCGVPGVPS
jgi:hypothetical protein